MSRSIIRDRSYAFALQSIKLYQQLVSNREYVLSKQLLKSATSIKANVREALAAQSRPDFLSKMSIASKEAQETIYWLELLRESGLAPSHITSLIDEATQIGKMLTSIVKTTAKSPKLASPSRVASR